MGKNYQKGWVAYYDRRAETFKDPLEISEMILQDRKVDRHFLRQEGKRIEGLLQPDRNKALLDLGCCAGVALSLIAGKFRECTGVDLAGNALEHARRRLPHLRFIEDDITRLRSIASRSFSYVMAYGVLHYMEQSDQAAFLKTLSRVCKKGARVVLMRIPNARLCGEYQGWRAIRGKKPPKKRGAPRWCWVDEDFIKLHSRKDFEIFFVFPPADSSLPLKAFFDVVLIKKA